jgi:two-component system, OmpR family, response regulator ResD
MATMTSFKVLVVDDDPMVRDVLRVMLGFEGCQIVDAPDGESALVMSAAIRPDVVILDVTVPGINGFEVCRQLKSSPEPPRVVILTARYHPEDERRGLEAGADAYLRKPFSPLQILETVGVKIDGDGV